MPINNNVFTYDPIPQSGDEIDGAEFAEQTAEGINTALSNIADTKTDLAETDSDLTALNASLVTHKADTEPHGATVTPTAGHIPLYKDGGVLAVNTPIADEDAANKKYVDDTVTPVAQAAASAQAGVAGLTVPVGSLAESVAGLDARVQTVESVADDAKTTAQCAQSRLTGLQREVYDIERVIAELPKNDFETATPEGSDLTAFALKHFYDYPPDDGETEADEPNLRYGTAVVNLFNNHLFVYREGDDEEPNDGIWEDCGMMFIGQATNTAWGVVKGSASDYKVSVDPDTGEMTCNLEGMQVTINGIIADQALEQHFRGYFSTTTEIATLPNPKDGDYAFCAETGTKWAYDADSWIDTLDTVPDQTVPASDTTPLMDGTAAPGTSEEYARGDHIHPTDTGRAPTSHTHTKNQITDFPASLPASDVSAWAKAASKPTYTANEVGAAAANATLTDAAAADTLPAITSTALGAILQTVRNCLKWITSKFSGGVLTVANGGTGQTTAALARNALGLGNTTDALPIANGGTGATTAAAALTALGGVAASGNVATATKLATARKINGVNFDGTGDITVKAEANGGAVVTSNFVTRQNNTVATDGFDTLGATKPANDQVRWYWWGSNTPAKIMNPVASADTAGNVSGVVAIANGGTGQTSAALARNALGLGNTTGALPIANGGTGATTAASALTALGGVSASGNVASAKTLGNPSVTVNEANIFANPPLGGMAPLTYTVAVYAAADAATYKTPLGSAGGSQYWQVITYNTTPTRALQVAIQVYQGNYCGATYLRTRHIDNNDYTQWQAWKRIDISDTATTASNIPTSDVGGNIWIG
jgi:hypothetical protein